MGANERGDTIIEVVVAVAVFALVAITGLAMMNQGTAMAQRTLEIGLVRQQMDAQADGLRYLNRAFVMDYDNNGLPTEAWRKIADEANGKAVSSAVPFQDIFDTNGCVLPTSGKAFALDLNELSGFMENPTAGASKALLTPTITTPTYSQIRYTGGVATAEGIWIEAVRSPDPPAPADQKPGFYDFHIRACWNTPGQQQPVILGTIVRLYEPRS